MNKRIKRRLYTGIGIAASFLIAFLGWILINSLIDRDESLLFSTRGYLHVETPAPEQASFVPTLNMSEMYTILYNWNHGTAINPHEPKENQLNMEQAINAGIDVLSYFNDQDVLFGELLAYEKVNASLCEKTERTYPSGAEQNQIRDMQLLEPFFSYWTVVFKYSDMTVTLIINAVTGQAWNIDFTDFSSSSELNHAYTERILSVYASYLGFDNIGTYENNEDRSVFTVNDSSVALIVSRRPGVFLEIYLATVA